MKLFKRVLTLLLVVVGIVSLSACKKEVVEPVTVTEYNALGAFEDGGDGVYSITTNTEAKLAFTYDKGTFTDAYMVKDVSETDLSTFAKLVVTVEGTGTVLVKLEKADGSGKEISLNVTGITGSYEWNMKNDSDFLADVVKIVMISAPGKEDSTGDITISKLLFSVDVASNYIIQTGFNNIPENVNEYDGESARFDFNAKWENFADDVYQVTYEANGTNVSFAKETGFEWAAIQSAVQADFTDFNYIVLKVSGTEGQKLLAKPSNFNAYEGFIFLTGDEQELVLDLSAMPVAEKNAITEIFVFGAAGAAKSGDFVIHEAFFAKDYEYEAVVYDHNVYTDGAEFGLEYWYDGGDLNYTLTEDGTDTIVNYNKTGEWTYMLAHIDGDLSSFATVEVVASGTLNKTALLKIEGPAGNKEEAITFDGTMQTFTIDLSTMTPAQLSQINKFLIFAAQGSNIGSGTFTIHSVTFKEGGTSVNDLWAENDLGTYAVTVGDTSTTVDYTKGTGQEWVFLKADLTAIDTSAFNTLTMTLDGTAGKTVLVKPNDNGALEQTVTFGDEPVTITITVPELTSILVFAEPNTASVSGSFEIIEAKLSTVYIPAADVSGTFDFTTGEWTEGDAGTYAYSTVADETLVTYTKGVGQEWSFGKITFANEDVAGLKTLTLVLDGTAGKTVLLKPNDDGALEQTVTFGAEPVTVVINADAFTSLVFFAEPGTAEVNGTFTIVSAKLSNVVSTTTWIDNGDGAYTLTENGTVIEVEYDKITGQEWAFIRANFDAAETAGLNTLTMTVDGPTGKTILIKPNDNGALEQTVTFGAEPVTITITVEDLTTIILFGDPGTTNVTGTFEIIETLVSYTEEG